MNNKAVLMRMLVILGIASLLFLAGCGGGTGQSLNNQPAAPIPTITTISPIGAMAGGPAFTLTVNGTNFVPASAVNFGGTARTTTFVTPTQLTPTGKFAYVTNSLSSDVSMYTIDGTTGALTSIGTIAAGTGPVFVAVDPTGKFAYVANSGSNNVSMYSIDATTGALMFIGTIGT